MDEVIATNRCVVCGKFFVVTSKKALGKAYCSNKCSAKYYKNFHEQPSLKDTFDDKAYSEGLKANRQAIIDDVNKARELGISYGKLHMQLPCWSKMRKQNER